MDAPEYRIKTVSDFLDVPIEKRGECLRDFSAWMRMADHSKEINREINGLFDLPEGSTTLVLDEFIWADDGIEGVSEIRFDVGDVESA